MSLHFLNGVHTLPTSNQSFKLLNIYSLIISGDDVGPIKESGTARCVIEAPYISLSNISVLIIQNCHLVESFLEISKVDSLIVHHFAFASSSLMINVEINPSFISLSDSIVYQTSLILHISTGKHVIVFERSSFFGQDSGIVWYVQPFDVGGVNESDVTLSAIKCSFSDNSTGITIISGSTVALSVLECKFQRNRRGLSMTVIKGDFHALVENTVFDRLTHNQGLQTYFFTSTKLNEKHLTLRNVSYLQNNVNFYLGTLVLSGPLNLTVEKCIFRENFGLISTLFLRSVNILVRKQNYFISNIGSTGGALYMSHTSTLWLDKGAYIAFENNTATKLGGAIFVEEAGHKSFLDASFSAGLKAKCFYQLPFTVDIEIPAELPTLSFLNNSAEMGGDNIYGASLASDCEVISNGKLASNEVKDQIFSLSFIIAFFSLICSKESLPM